jgi:carbon starvation protein CstA
MTTRQWVIAILILAPVAALLGVYVGLVKDGSLAPPDFVAIARDAGFATDTVTQMVFAWIIIGSGLLAAFVPIIYALRARDPLTAVVSFVMTASALAMWLLSRTVIVQVSAVIIYIANITLSAIVYAAHKISSRQP